MFSDVERKLKFIKEKDDFLFRDLDVVGLADSPTTGAPYLSGFCASVGGFFMEGQGGHIGIGLLQKQTENIDHIIG